ncbi:L-type lectin-domain containing receptor kinase IX.1-like [Eucalyptus grandis]|uniref:L-type lectin-domain containing receptor kinase IX.1-like n=1 Tax=Eucalyptus grandis TaxID=71139 RepID=UPI00192EF0D3|nr:L-type lectin-domain containing receptor kinase IX.1-like [Eucalyptus grandis]
MRSFGRHKDQPQPPTTALVLLVLTISLLKPFSASALHFDNPCFMFPDGFDTHKHLAHQENASENGRLNGISDRATYSSKVHFRDKDTGDVADCVTQYTASSDSQQGNPLGNPLGSQQGNPLGSQQGNPLGIFASLSSTPIPVILNNSNCKGECEVYTVYVIMKPSESGPGCGGILFVQFSDRTLLGRPFGHLARPDSDCVAVNNNRHKNTWGIVVPFTNTHMNFRANVQWKIKKQMLGGSSSSITYDPRTKCLSVGWRDADGNSSNEIHRHYCTNSSRAYMPEMVGVCVIAPPESALEYRFTQIWELSSGSQLQVEKATDSWLKWPFTVVAGVVVLVAIIVAWVNYRSEVSSPETERGGEEGNLSTNLTKELKMFTLKEFSFKELMIMTDSFALDRTLGEGAFGIVYKGYMVDADAPVAVKILKSVSDRGIKDYIAEVKSLSQLRHRNLVALIGYCHEKDKFALVYEFMSEGSLGDHLFKDGPLLPWEKRYNIVLGLGSAVHYLQKAGNQCVIHRDIKSSNIMLNENFEAKLGDFGTARPVDRTRGPEATEAIGTNGYVAPEYGQTGESSKESDVFSFGVVLLEIVCGRIVFDSELGKQRLNLVQWVWKRYGSLSLAGRVVLSWRWRNKFLEVVDPRLGKDFDKKQAEALLIVGLWCAHPIAACRPSIEEAMAVLNLKAEPPKLPSKMPRFNVN